MIARSSTSRPFAARTRRFRTRFARPMCARRWSMRIGSAPWGRQMTSMYPTKTPMGSARASTNMMQNTLELDPNASVHGIRFNPDNPDGLTHVIKFLSAKADELADVITRKTKAPAVRLIQDPVSCAIEGVTYLDGNKEVNVRANKGVVMCCGGFENNPEMMANYFKAYGCHPAAAVHNTGDGIVMCEKVGASMWHMHGIAGFWPHVVSLDWNGLHLEPGDDRFRLRYLRWNERPAIHSRVPGGFLRQQHARGVGSQAHQRQSAWRLPERRRVDDAPSAGRFPGASSMLRASRRQPRTSPSTIRWLRASLTAPTQSRALRLRSTCRLKSSHERLQRGMPCCKTAEIRSSTVRMTGLRLLVEPPFYAARQCPSFLNTDGGPERNEFGQVRGS